MHHNAGSSIVGGVYSFGPPWKLALIGVVAGVAGVALLLVDWSLPQLAVFVAMFFVARGALHIVTTSFEGVPGALSGLVGCGEFGVGVTLLAWPDPTLLVVVVVVGSLVILHGATEAAIVLATRKEWAHWPVRFVSTLVEVALGVTLIARPGGTVGGTAATLGGLAILEGLVEVATAIGHQRREHHAPASAPNRPTAAIS